MTLAEINKGLETAANAVNPNGDIRFGPISDLAGQKILPLIVVNFPSIVPSVELDRVKTVYAFQVLVLVSDSVGKPTDARQGVNRPNRRQAFEQADALRVAYTNAVLVALEGVVGIDTGSVGQAVYNYDKEGTLLGYQYTINVTAYGPC